MIVADAADFFAGILFSKNSKCRILQVGLVNEYLVVRFKRITEKRDLYPLMPKYSTSQLKYFDQVTLLGRTAVFCECCIHFSQVSNLALGCLGS